MEKEKTLLLAKEKQKKSLDITVPLVILTVAITLLDLYSHPHAGLADLERRQALENLIGSITNHLGNFGISASLAITTVFAKNLFDQVFHSEIAKKITKLGYTLSLSSILTLNALIESFPGNNELIGDTSMGILGVAIATIATNLAINRFQQAKNPT